MNDLYLLGLKLREMPPRSSYLSKLPVVKHLRAMKKLEFHAPVTFFAGENGTGKSTLLEAIAVSLGFNPEGGSRDFQFSTHDDYSELHEYLTLAKTVRPKDGFFLRAESFYNTASYLDDNSEVYGYSKLYGKIPLHAQSHGESFLAVAVNRFLGNGIYLLDEPEAALSPQRVMSLIVAIDTAVKKHSQFIICTHSPILLSYPRAEILSLSESGITPVSYRETEAYRITKQFIENPGHMLRLLLED